MSAFLRGAAAAVLVLLATVGAAGLAGINVDLQIAGGESTPAPTVAGDTAAPTEAATSTPTPTPDPGAAVTNVDVRRTFAEQLNEFRVINGRSNLHRTTVLHKAAKAHSTDMAERGYFSHSSPDGDTFNDRVRAQGGQCTIGGENIYQTWWKRSLSSSTGPDYIATEEQLATALFEGWRASPGHRDVMLIHGVTGMGLGVAVTESGKVYATLVVC